MVKMFLKKIIKHFLTTFTKFAHSSERHTVEIFRLFGVFLELHRNLRGVSDGSKNLKRSIRLWAVFERMYKLSTRKAAGL